MVLTCSLEKSLLVQEQLVKQQELLLKRSNKEEPNVLGVEDLYFDQGSLQEIR